MAHVMSIGTYLPPWDAGGRRVAGPDEDALTMAVAAGRAADPKASAKRVVMVSRNFPLLEGGNAAVLLAGLSLSADVQVSEVLGGAPATLDQIVEAAAGTLVVAADHSPAAVGAAAVLIGDGAGATVSPLTRRSRSLPVQIRSDDGSRRTYTDPRLQREVGVKSTLKQLGLAHNQPVVVAAGTKASQLGSGFDAFGAIEDPVSSSSGVIRLIAEAIDSGATGVVLAVEQASVTAAQLTAGAARIARDEQTSRRLPTLRVADGVGIPISLASYARAFDPKLRWEAATFEARPGIDATPLFPPRVRVESNGTLAADYKLQPLPRTGTVYTYATVRVPVPDLPSPYTLAVIQLDGSAVRVLLKVTGVEANGIAFGQSGTVVLRKIASRSGVPDYGYMFWPGKTAVSAAEGADGIGNVALSAPG
ncbi:hypothetical protein MINTM020_01030 [Mycobacterium paraintracellulare]|uniref:OB-fold domain-containing protein n=1 Tax=Mycobacterium paraintracellulare TaxID=1138383 RepID=UPI001925366C|nr:OB-fold domain-containing protein [Mycobacterium paraintracellulare]BCP08005.1 hypothetical protein MINTM020_01030 [Mycobacterium paraintracellulare]